MSSSSPSSPPNPFTASTAHAPTFTPEMQDRQARNKDPWTGKAPPAFGSISDDEDDEGPERGVGSRSNTAATAANAATANAGGGSAGRTHAHGAQGGGHHQNLAQRRVVTSAADAYESAQKRRLAAAVLTTPELLQFHALSRNDSIPATRQHFTAMLCGYDIEPSSSCGATTGTGAGGAASAMGAAASVGSAAGGSKNRKEKGKEKAVRPVSEVVYKPFTGAFEL